MSDGDAVLLENVARGLVAFDSGGNIVGGLAERWNVSDDGLSYIFRLSSATWSNGRKVTAEQVARALRRSLSAGGKNRLRDALGAVEEVVAMTDRVIEIRLTAPRPNLLALLAQPEFAILRRGSGTGPFSIDPKKGKDGAILLTRTIGGSDEENERTEQLELKGEPAKQAIADFAAGKAELVLGGRFSDLPLTRRVKLDARRASLRPGVGPVRAGPDEIRRAVRERRGARPVEQGDRPRFLRRGARRAGPGAARDGARSGARWRRGAGRAGVVRDPHRRAPGGCRKRRRAAVRKR